jgi:hypothetical protein
LRTLEQTIAQRNLGYKTHKGWESEEMGTVNQIMDAVLQLGSLPLKNATFVIGNGRVYGTGFRSGILLSRWTIYEKRGAS